MIKFLDTNVLLQLNNEDDIVICHTSLLELEQIKSSYNKDQEVKARARHVLKWIYENEAKITIVPDNVDAANELGLELSPDVIICSTAYWFSKSYKLEFVTLDLSCRFIAQHLFGLKTVIPKLDRTDYKGFKEVYLTHDELSDFYLNKDNRFELLTNEYLIISTEGEGIVDSLRWAGDSYQQLTRTKIDTKWFNKMKPKDIYQTCLIDSILNNTITAISGLAGSGKTLIALMSAMYLIEKGSYDRIVILFNPTKARGATDMGYYGGDFLDKALQNSIGHILTTKFGDRYAVDVLLRDNKLKLVSMADCRGMEIGDNEILWITEAQNTSKDLIKLCLSRVSSGAKVIIEGDYLSQVDSHSFEGFNNGLLAVIEAFKGHEEFGYVELQNVHRSRLAELAQLL